MLTKPHQISSRATLIVGFASILVLVLMSFLLEQYLIKDVIKAQKDIVEIHTLKKDISFKLRIYAQQRFLDVSRMLHTDDVFLINDLKSDRTDSGSDFIFNLLILRKLQSTPEEAIMLGELRTLVNKSASLVDEIIDLIDNGNSILAQQYFDNKGLSSQIDVYNHLKKFGELQETYVQSSIAEIDKLRQRFQYFIIILNLFLIVTGAGLAMYTIRRIGSTESQLIKERQQAITTLENISDSVISLDKKGLVDFINPSAENLLQIDAQHAQGKKLRDILFLYNSSQERSSTDILNTSTDSPRRKQQFIMRNVYDDNIYVELEQSSYMDIKRKNVFGYVITIKDISTERQSVLALEQQAYTDLLTGLKNRYSFEKHLTNILDGNNAQPSSTILYVDLDRFKVVNDTCGHHAGDELLKKVASLFSHNIRSSDILARIGGDEFAILLQNCSVDESIRIANILIEVIATFRFVWEEETFSIGISIGVTNFDPNAGTRVEDILQLSDAACFQAKNNGRNTYSVSNMDKFSLSQQANQINWSEKIQQSMVKNELVLLIQTISPTILDEENAIPLQQILIRYKNDDGNLIDPDVFSSAIERFELMFDLDMHVINLACQYLLKQNNMRVFIQLSAQTVINCHTIDRVLSTLQEYAITASSICFEITETTAVSHLHEVNKFISSIKTVGCQVCLSEVGCGVTSASYLQKLAIDYLKLSEFLVPHIGNSEFDYQVLKSIQQLAVILGLQTIVKNIDNTELLEKIKEIGIHYVQANPPVKANYVDSDFKINYAVDNNYTHTQKSA